MLSKSNDNVTVGKEFHSTSINSTDSLLHNKMPFLTINNINSKVTNLHVSTGLSTCLSGSSSPPPPALSPVNSSPVQSETVSVNHTSPSPPVIVAEIGVHSSASSQAPSDCRSSVMQKKNSHEQQHRRNFDPPCLLSSFTTSSSSSSSSTSCNYATTGIPILEKISMSIGSPRKHLGDVLNSTPESRSTEPDRILSTNQSISTLPISPLLQNLNAIQPVVALCENIPCDSKATDDQTYVKPTAKRKRASVTSRKSRLKCGKNESDSKFELDRSEQSHGRSGTSFLPNRLKQREYGKRSSVGLRASKNKSAIATTGSDSSTNRRYLESPFLCLCQSGSVVPHSVVRPTDNQRAVTTSSSFAPSTTDFLPNITSAGDPVVMMSSLPGAHVISPVLMDSTSSTGAGVHISSLPPSCPFYTGRWKENCLIGHDHSPIGGDASGLFAGIHYRPSTNVRIRDGHPISGINMDNPWLCVFCGRDNNFLELGSLYGPYWLDESERSQLPADMLDDAVKSYNPLPSSSSFKVESLDNPAPAPSTTVGQSKKIIRASRSTKVYSSTTTTGSIAPNRRSKTGELKLVIKAPKPSQPVRKPSQSQSNQKGKLHSLELSRIGSNGEVWFHLQCVLWAPGTYIQGNGTIGGLGEALQLALDCRCSHCDKRGAILGCCSRGCSSIYHFHCALRSECQLDETQFTLMCKKHHIYS